MPARQTSVSKPKTTRSTSNKSVKPNSNPASATPRSVSVNEDYNATVAYNKELTLGLLNQASKKIEYTPLDEDRQDLQSIQQQSQPARDQEMKPEDLDSGSSDSEPLNKHNGNLHKDDTEKEQSDEEEEEDSFDPAAFNGRSLQKRGRLIAFSRTPQFQLGPWESLPNTNKASMAFMVSKAAVASNKMKKTTQNGIGFYIHRSVEDMASEDTRQYDQITCIIQHSTKENKAGNYVWQTFPKEQYVCPTTFGTFQDKYMTSAQLLDYKQQQLLIVLTAFHRIATGHTDPSIERVIVCLNGNQPKILKQTSANCFLNPGSVLIKRPLTTSMFDVLVCWSKPQTLKEIVDSDKYHQHMIPSKFIEAIVKEFKLTDIHQGADLRYMGLESSGAKDQYAFERNDFMKLSNRFTEFLRFIIELYESQQLSQPILVENFRTTNINDPKLQLRFVKELFGLARLDIDFNADLYQIVTLESVSANEYFGGSFSSDRDEILYGAATGGYNGFVGVYLRHVATGKFYQFMNNASYNKPWVNYERLEEEQAKDIHFASLLIFNTKFSNLVEWDTTMSLKKSEFESTPHQKTQFYNLTYAFMMQQLQFMELGYGLGTLLRVHMPSLVDSVSIERMKICALQLNTQFFKDQYRDQLISFMNTTSLLSGTNGFLAPVLTRDNTTRKAQLMTLFTAEEIYDGPLKKIQVSSFNRKFHWIHNFRVMATYRNPLMTAKTTEPNTHTFSFYPQECSDRIQKDYKNVLHIFTYAERVKKQITGSEEVKESETKRQRV